MSQNVNKLDMDLPGATGKPRRNHATSMVINTKDSSYYNTSDLPSVLMRTTF